MAEFRARRMPVARGQRDPAGEENRGKRRPNLAKFCGAMRPHHLWSVRRLPVRPASARIMV